MSVEACAELVRRGDPDRFMAVMAAPPAARVRLFPIHAFNIEIARIPWITQEPLIAEMRLQWWRDVVQAVGDGGDVPGHEIARPLAETIRTAGLPRDAVGAMIDARRHDIHAERFSDADALWDHLDATAGNLMRLCARSLGADATADPLLRELGMADGLARWFLAVPELAARGREPLPDPAPAAVGALARAGLERLARAGALRGRIASGAVPALAAAWRAGPILSRAAADPGRVAAGGCSEPEFRRRWGLLWRSLSGRW